MKSTIFASEIVIGNICCNTILKTGHTMQRPYLENVWLENIFGNLFNSHLKSQKILFNHIFTPVVT